MPRIRKALGLKRLPHFTTVQKAFQRLSPAIWEALAADKGYDDQTHRRKLRAWGKRPSRKHREFAPYDKAANARMDAHLYHRRSLVETVISVLKRKYGDGVRSRVW